MFIKLQKATSGFVNSVCPSVCRSTWNNLASTGQTLMISCIMDFHYRRREGSINPEQIPCWIQSTKVVHITLYLITPCVLHLVIVRCRPITHAAGHVSASVIINCKSYYSLCGNIHLLNDQQTVQVLTVRGSGATEHTHGNSIISDNILPLAMAHWICRMGTSNWEGL